MDIANWLQGLGLVQRVQTMSAGRARYDKLAMADAAMILSGMGPMGELKTTGGKLFAGTYAIFLGFAPGQ